MYEIVKSVIESGRYELADMLRKIDNLWVQNELTEEQKKELVTLARNNAIPENSYADVQTQINKLVTMIEANQIEIRNLADRMIVLEGGTPEIPPAPEEWPEYKQPTGAHDAYYNGDKITYKTKHYICVMPNGSACSWPPDEYPQGWEEQI